MKVRHITFGSRNYSHSVRQLRASAARFGLKTYAFTDRHPVFRDLQVRHPEIMGQRRGAGYWLWKPAVILDALENVPDGTVVMYTDAGMQMVSDPRPMLAYASDFPMMIFEHTFPLPSGPVIYPNGLWTKRDCMVLLDADRPEVYRLQQAMAGIQIYRNCRQSREFVREVLHSAADPRVITDMPNTQGRENLQGFQEHRHDQSVLTIVAWRHKLPRFPDPTQLGHETPRPALGPEIDGLLRPAANFARIFHLHRKSDYTALRKIAGLVNPIRSGQWRNYEASLEIP